MNENTVEGALQNGVGKVESATGEALDNPGLQAKGEVRQFAGKAQAAAGDAEDTLRDTVDYVNGVLNRLKAQADELYGHAAGKVREVAGQVEPMVKERPYVALGAVAAAGLLAGLLLAGRGPKVIYLKPRS